ncbi:MAG: preprotein translocase subunit SecA [Egibacteraceae bacterium]
MVLQKFLRMGEGRQIRKLERLVAEVNAVEDSVTGLSDEQLRARTTEFRSRLDEDETLDDLLPEAFATVREAAHRVLDQRAFDVQVLGGAALHQGDIAEMKTGEGKTLTSTMPVYLNALDGKGVHVVTVNPYLAARDAEWMGRVYRFLGLQVGLVFSQQPRPDKRMAYAADVTYGTNNEFGFDFLRDHMVLKSEDKVQRGHSYCIVDEVDSILVDEARTPLIISGPADQATEWYTVFARRVAPKLTRDEHYEVDEAKRTVAVTEEGVTKVEQLLGIDNMYESVNTPLIHHLQNALKARELFKRDREYIVVDGEVKIVDENTGRVLDGRRYSEGLHQSIEAKEGVKVKEENQTLATITLQNYYRGYDKLAGMTGTAKTEESEFMHIYATGVVEVPTNRDIVRLDKVDLIYKSEAAKLEAVVLDLLERQERGQPVLVGTASVEKSEKLSAMLTKRGLRHEVLNAKNHFKEAEIVAQAGRIGAVTVATNMAGRGVDIMLGGNPESRADADARKQIDPEVDPDGFAVAYADALERYVAECQAEGDKVRELGGLYVLGTERHESRRIDNQLRGRGGRQGDPGESRFYLSLEDDLMRLFNASAVESIMTRLKLPEEDPIGHKMVSKAVQRAQGQVESRNFEIRKNVLKYDDVMNNQRKVIYEQRNVVMGGTDEQVEEFAEDFIEDAVRNLCGQHAAEGVYPEEWTLEELWISLERIYPVSVDRDSIDLDDTKAEDLAEMLVTDAMERYEERESELGSDTLRQVERRVILSVVDRIWREHLYEMDHLRDGIGLRAVGQRDPLREYEREAYYAFNDMMAQIKEQAAGYFYNLPVRKTEEREQEDEGRRRQEAQVAPPALRAQPAPQPAPQFSYSSATSASSAPAAGATSYTVSSTQSSGTSGGNGGGGSATAPARPAGMGAPGAAAAAAAAQHASGAATSDKVGRNEPCPCGSGQKYKKCHGG